MSDGGSCPWRYATVVDGLPLCDRHAAEVEAKFTQQSPDEKSPHPPAVKMLPPKAVQAIMVSARPTVPSRNVEAVVYYLGDPDTQMVKIGTSTRLRHRIDCLRAGRPRLLLLATEPGTYSTERRRHYQFRTLREPLPTGEREWFRKAPVLMEHIGRVRLQYGIISPGSAVWHNMIAPLRR